MTPALEHVLILITQYGYLMLLVLAIVEGPIVCVIAGFILAQGTLSFAPVFLILTVGDVAGDLFWYGVGYYGSRHPRMQGWLRKHEARMDAFKARLRDNLAKAIFLVKYTQTGMFAMPAAGVAHVPVLPFALYNILSSLPKTLLLMGVGYFFGYALDGIDTGLRIGSLVLGAAMLAFVVYYYRRFMREEAREERRARHTHATSGE